MCIRDSSIRSVEFRHIPTQTLFPPAETKLVKLDIKNLAQQIGYIAGAGDEVPAALRQMGCRVTMLDEKELGKDLAVYDAIVVGVRAYNTDNYLGFYQEKLMDYVKQGGTMVVQYVTPVSYTHLDVYKRQVPSRCAHHPLSARRSRRSRPPQFVGLSGGGSFQNLW